MRRIKVYTTVGVSGTIDTNVRTLGELKPILSEREIDYSGMKLLVGETRNELNVDDAILPEGDFKLYLMPQKTKSGGLENDIESLQDSIDIVENKVDRILSILDNGRTSESKPSAKNSVSYEDQEAIEDLKRLSGNSGTW